MIIASHKKEKNNNRNKSWATARVVVGGWVRVVQPQLAENRNETILEIYSLCPWGPTVQRDNCNEASKWAKKRQRKTDTKQTDQQ